MDFLLVSLYLEWRKAIIIGYCLLSQARGFHFDGLINYIF